MMRTTTLVAGLVLLLAAGCAQNTETPVAQPVQQTTATPTSTDQLQATEGTRITYNLFFGITPGQVAAGKLRELGDVDLGDMDDPDTLPYKSVVSVAGKPENDTNTGWSMQSNTFTFTNTTGGTTPSATGAATGTVTAAASPVAYPTVTPTQDVRPEASVAVPVGVALPGGIASPQGVATGRGTTSGTTQANEQDANAVLTWIKANPDVIPQILQGLTDYIAKIRGLTPPASQPANYGINN